MAKNHILEGTISYPSLDQPRAGNKNQKPKYGATIILSKEFQQSAAFKALLEDAQEVAVEKFGSKGKAMVTFGGKHSTFRNDVAEKGYPEGSIYFGARNESQPGLVYPWADPTTVGVEGVKPKPALVPQDKIKETFYPGAKVRVSVRPFGYEAEGNKGVGFGLNNVQFIGHGTRLDGRKAATEEFEADLSVSPESLDDLAAELTS